MKRTYVGLATGVAAALALATGCSGSAPESSDPPGSERLVATVASSLTAADTAFFVAEDENLFAEHGLDVDEVPVNGTAPALVGLSNGSIHIVDASPFVVAKANQEGMDLRFFCGTLNVNWPGFLARADSDTVDADEAGFEAAVQALRGKVIGVGARGGGIEAISNSILGAAGLSPRDVEYGAVGFGEGAIGQLEIGNVDALLTYPYLTQQAGDRGALVVDVPSHAPEKLRDAMNAGWVASKSWLESHPDAAEAFCAGLGDGVSFVQDESNSARTSEVLGARFGLADVDVGTELLGEGKPLALLTTELDCRSMEYALEIGLQQDQFEAEPAPNCDNLLWDGARR